MPPDAENSSRKHGQTEGTGLVDLFSLPTNFVPGPVNAVNETVKAKPKFSGTRI